MNAHHIKHFCDFPDLRFDINNGITMCEECHKKIHISLTEKDIIAKKEYDSMYPKYEFISPKKRKLKKLCALTEKPEAYWNKLQSKQLGKILTNSYSIKNL